MEAIQRSDVISTARGSLDTAPPLDSLTLSASIFNRAVARVTTRQAAAHSLRPSEFGVIRLLLSSSEWTATDIAKALSIGVSAASRIVRGLVGRGLVQRRRPRENRRKVLLSLTDEGVSLGMGFLRETHSYERLLTQDIDPGDLESCIATFGRLVENYIAWEKSGGASFGGTDGKAPCLSQAEFSGRIEQQKMTYKAGITTRAEKSQADWERHFPLTFRNWQVHGSHLSYGQAMREADRIALKLDCGVHQDEEQDGTDGWTVYTFKF